MSTSRAVLVVGGGTAGNTLAVLLRRAGAAVDLVESKQDWDATAGSGITLQGNALRVLREVGIWDELRAQGYPFDSLGIRAPDGSLLHVGDDLRTGGPDLPATLGTDRAQLQRLLIDRVRGAGAEVRLATTVTSLRQQSDQVEVAFSDGTGGHYDLVVGADGLHSRIRSLIGIPDQPVATGMEIWRAAVPRPPEVTRTEIVYGGRCCIAGYCPTGDRTMYAYLVERSRGRASPPRSSHAAQMRSLAADYGGPWRRIRAALTDSAAVNHTRFDHMLIAGPWHRGRVVLVGDAAHCCPPTLAQGAAMSLEDASVLAELLATRKAWDERLFAEYQRRRMPRVRPVVEASVRITRELLAGADGAAIPEIMEPATSGLQEAP